jgi:hypothetical protein
MIGSTCVAYGGVNATLEAADQLALFFWQEIAAGYSGGRALQQAKVAYARHLDARQGYLDGEDQKTLISFVYYGDPTLTAPTTAYGVSRRGRTRTWKRLTECPPTVCSKRRASEPAESVPEELVQAVRNRVAGYLPGMENAKLTVTRQKLCQGRQCERPCNGCDAKTSGIDVQRMLFTMRQTEQAEGAVHQRLVKVTVDQHGKMVKMAVSK